MKVHFRRPELAKELVKELEGKNLLSDASNGLFLAAERRTGKTEFLKQDLMPALREAGFLVAYVDLWSDKSKSPMILIAAKLAEVVRDNLGMVAKAAKEVGADSINLGGFKVDLSKIGTTEGMTLADVLALIKKQTGKRMALIIDEAQHALTSNEGDACMSALKSARDQLRDDDGAGLLLIMSGSHKDKLMRLLATPAAPFWGSQVRPLPHLSRPFCKYIGDLVRAQTGAPLNDEVLYDAFVQCAYRPQFLLEAIRVAALNEEGSEEDIERRVLQITQLRRQQDRDDLNNMFAVLEPLAQAIFWRLLEKAGAFKPFDSESLAFYSKHCNKKVSAAQAQKAMEKLRDHDPPLVWKSLRGEYALYEIEMRDWYAYLVSEGRWPPSAANQSIP